MTFDGSYEASLIHAYTHTATKHDDCPWCNPPPGVVFLRTVHSEPGNPDEPFTVTEAITLSKR